MFVLTACTDSAKESRVVFKYNELGTISSLDPAYARNFENIWAVNQLYDGLFEFDENLVLKPCLVDSFSIQDSGLTYYFRLKENVLFHDGKYLTAKDVEFSLKRLKSSETASPGSWVLNDVEVNESGNLNISILSDKELLIKLKAANSSFLQKLAMPYCKVIPKTYFLNNKKSFARKPIGSGPFKFFLWEDRVKLVFHAFEKYHQKNESGERLPFIDAVSISFLKDDNAVFMSGLKGDYHLVSGLKGEFKDELINSQNQLKEKYKKRFKLKSAPYLYTEYLGFNLEESSALTKHSELRQALSMAINREQLISKLRAGIGEWRVNGFTPNVLLRKPTSKFYEYNPTAAKHIVDSIYKAASKENETIVLSASPQQSDLCEFIQNEWQKLGFKVEINTMPVSTFRDYVANNKLSLFRKSWIADYPDPENFLALFSKANFSPNGPNYTHFSNDAFERSFNEMKLAKTDSVKLEMALELEAILAEQMPVIPLYYGEVTHLLKQEVEGLNINGMNILSLKKVKIKS